MVTKTGTTTSSVVGAKAPLRQEGLDMHTGEWADPSNGVIASGQSSLSPDKTSSFPNMITINENKPTREQFSPGYILIITIGGIAIAEIIAMGVVYLYRTLPYIQQILIDATVMTAIIFPLLYMLSTRPLLNHIHQRALTESILQARLRLSQYANTHTLDELLQFTLDEIEALIGSTIGFFHLVGEDQKTLRLRAWSTNTIQNMCTLDRRDSHYSVEQAGVWADCIRERRSVIHNDYTSLSHRKGLPEGHASITREMAVPILRNERIVAVLGTGNKPKNFTTDDMELVSTLGDFAWDVVTNKQAREDLRESEEKFRTLADWTYDWEIWLDPHGGVVYNSPSCKRITGYGSDEFTLKPDLLIQIVHPEDRKHYKEHHQLIHDENAGVTKMEYRIVARDGAEHWIEHICRPLFAEDRHYLGRRVSNREITERVLAHQSMLESNQKEKTLTQRIHTMQLDIARDLHDTIGQNIAFLRMKLDHLSEGKVRRPADIRMEIEHMARAANESYDLIRGTLAILQAEDSSDIYRLFIRYAEQVEERSSFKINVSTRGEPRTLSTPRMRQLFYIFRESLNNIEKHANASQVTIEMNWDPECLDLMIADNGMGFDTEQIQFGGHYGIKFMRERVELLNGTLDLRSTIGSGTQVEVHIPCVPD